ncbi:ParA family protein [Rubellicoccus peritrichatus]|uniref:AAA family ATPase n=1 Tax=Rubellicoccus peritrichatus TaxID=3080537 RepID=A0AAQ3QVW4_9BACT|nr:AAA family ATPase [Puniceicoccus sp. CR14]WOO42063.1 AAA family ATPase [Puniceicoccus sp. CR14]
MPRKICFINYKGGVGKTSLIVNTAASLVQKGKRVLLVDLDTQSNASIWLMRLDRWNKLNVTGKGSIYSLFFQSDDKLKDIIVKDVVEDKAGASILPGLDIAPTTFNLVDLESEYDEAESKPHYLTFYEQIKEIENDYDYILFDCPPNILKASQLGVFSANEIYVPANPDALSLIGFTLLVEKLLLFHKRSASFRQSGMGAAAAAKGIIFNSIKANVDIEVPKMRMQLRLNQFRNQKRVHPAAKIFESQIRDATVVRRAVTLGLPVGLVGQVAQEEDSVATDYRRLATEIDRHTDMI